MKGVLKWCWVQLRLLQDEIKVLYLYDICSYHEHMCILQQLYEGAQHVLFLYNSKMPVDKKDGAHFGKGNMN